MVAMILGKVTVQEALLAIAGTQALHSGISAVNNVNPPK
jgi:hypothetical protein